MKDAPGSRSLAIKRDIAAIAIIAVEFLFVGIVFWIVVRGLLFVFSIDLSSPQLLDLGWILLLGIAGMSWFGDPG